MKPGTDWVDVVNGQQWKGMMLSGAQALGQKKKVVDALNVFPVPDGDTGTNMHLTIQSAAKEAAKLSGDSLSEVAAAVSMGSLMGARGNSGVILSQLMRGIAKGLEGLTLANASQVAQALQMGVDTAYKAVMKPVEGTILTVAKETARGVMARAKQGGSVAAALKDGYQKGEMALAKTPELLPVLKQAGVVDAGGQGFLVIINGWIAALEGNSVAEAGMVGADLLTPLTGTEAGSQAQNEIGGIFRVEDLEYPYCTEFLLKGREIPLERIKENIAGWGDSMLVVGTPEIVKVHIHTKNPGKVLEYALQWGALHEVAIHNMLAQNEAVAHSLKEKQMRTASLTQGDSPLKEHGVVAVAMGEGIARVFTSLGADEVVFGGQTMNPSTEDLVEAVRRVSARHVYILPNNSNIIMAAQQAKEIVQECEVHVILSTSIPQGISALLNFQPEGDVEQNIQIMEEALTRVGSGEITYAVRDSEYEDFEIKAGEILGLADGKLVAKGEEVLTVAQATLEKLHWRDYDMVTIFFGQEVQPEEAGKLEDWLHQENRHVEVEVYPGGQPLYYYILGVE